MGVVSRPAGWRLTGGGGWNWRVRLRRAGARGKGSGSGDGEKERVSYAWDGTVEEWFVNDERGWNMVYAPRAAAGQRRTARGCA